MKRDRQNEHEKFQYIGGIYNGQQWSKSQEQGIREIESYQNTFFVSVNGQTVEVVVQKSAQGHKYLRTHPDKTKENNLLYLPTCP